MAQKLEIYRCNVCGNIVMVLHGGKGELVCCGKPMELLKENTSDVGREKHVPVVEKIADGYQVRVGSIPHPMQEKHYIEWIELQAGNSSYIKFLKPGEEPVAEFCTKDEEVSTRIYCNIHGLWRTE